jgi:tRNA(Ile)-lysidine synthase TilS/MesJ
VRPLLAVRRIEILQFLAARGLGFRRDASNGDLSLARNRARRDLSAAGEDVVSEIAREVSVLADERARLDRDYAHRVAPGVRAEADVTIADAALLARCPAELQRVALERLSAPFARPGRPPMTGRERERIRELLGSGADFRFEAGRRIRFERHGGALRIRLRAPSAPAPAVYDSGAEIPMRPEGGDQAL